MAHSTVSLVCSKCAQAFEAESYTSVNVDENPELKARVMNGSLFLHECPHCGTLNLARGTMLYHDPAQKLLICLSDRDLSATEVPEGYVCRLVSEVGALIEKVKIFDAGLDDIAIELCKYVTRMELGKDVDLKFFGAGGADGEITLTYPSEGKMEMLAIGYNVYRDSLAILSRNPILHEKATGLCKVDGIWLKQFIG